jgi:hypothetical protein
MPNRNSVARHEATTGFHGKAIGSSEAQMNSLTGRERSRCRPSCEAKGKAALCMKMDCIKTVIEYPSPNPIKDANILPNECEKWSPKAGIRNRYSSMFICDEKYCFLFCATKPHLDKILFY